MRPRVLVVEDARLTLRRLAAILESEGFEVQSVASRQEAAIALQRRAFDLLITDMNVDTPASVYDSGRMGKRDSRQPEIFILVSSVSTPDWKRQGVKAVFLNGFEAPRRMITTIQHALDGFVRIREFPMEPRSSPPPPPLSEVQPPCVMRSAALRVIVPHRTDNIIDGFTCSACQWSYWMKDARPFEVSWHECSQACNAFDGHVCSHYQELAAG